MTIIVEQKHSNLQNFYLPSVSNMTIQESGLSELNDQEKIESKWKRGSRKLRDWQKVATLPSVVRLAKSQLADKHY